jgi:hypothetical protein
MADDPIAQELPRFGRCDRAEAGCGRQIEGKLGGDHRFRVAGVIEDIERPMEIGNVQFHGVTHICPIPGNSDSRAPMRQSRPTRSGRDCD